jgi:uncharacterized protein (TIGR02145 family)
MKKINVLVMLLFLATVSAQAQVTHGDLKNPEPFSILELVSGSESNNGNRGLRLPQLTTEERETMVFTGYETEALGLQIFNRSTRCVETWNGMKWIQSCGQYGPRPQTGKLAYRDSGSGEISGWIEFMSYNLGATEMSIKEQLLHISPTISSTDGTAYTSEEQTAFSKVYGSLYQWGRKTDGHQNVWSSPTTGQTAAPTDAGTDNFLTGSSDWTSTPDNTLWDGEVSANNPCPPGFHVPSQADWSGIVKGRSTEEYLDVSENVGYGVNKWVWVESGSLLPSAATGIDLEGQTVRTSGYLIYPPTVDIPTATDADYQTTPTLFLPAAGYRYYYDGQLYVAGTYGLYWSSTVNGTVAYRTSFDSVSVNPVDFYYRADGLSVRCLSE